MSLNESTLEKSGLGMSVVTVWIIDLDSADDAVIFAETKEILLEAIQSKSVEA